MTKEVYSPKSELLKPYFTEESGIDSKEKAFAFILGVSFGKVIQIQAAKGINVSSNSLTWLRRLTLKGNDLPELYTKIRGKLIAYKAEGSERIRDIITELGELGSKLGDNINLDTIATNYFLLLGQSLTTRILP